MNVSGTNFSFDERVVSLYNHQRTHPAEVAAQIGQAIAAHTHPGGAILEIGVGTGRIAWPVAAQGRHVVGFDLSGQMLHQVESTRPADLSSDLMLTQADMHTMPFPDDTFSAALMVHVLHLARDWRTVMQETARVLKSDGVFIQGEDWIDPQSVMGKLRDELRMHAVRLDPSLMPPAAGVSRARFMQELGAHETTEVIAAEWVTWISPNERLEIIKQRIDAESWILSDELFDKMLVHLHDFAQSLWPDLDEKQPVNRRFVLKIAHGDW